MTEMTLQDSLEVIYSTFGRSVPSIPVVRAIRSRVCDIPDQAMGWIVTRICDEERLPSNVGLAIAHGWNAWQRAHPRRIARGHCTAGCDNGHWHCWEKNNTGKWVYFVSPCRSCRVRDVPIPSVSDLKLAGVDVMPSGFSGGPLEYDRQRRYGCLWPLELQTARGAAARVNLPEAVAAAADPDLALGLMERTDA